MGSVVVVDLGDDSCSLEETTGCGTKTHQTLLGLAAVGILTLEANLFLAFELLLVEVGLLWESSVGLESLDIKAVLGVLGVLVVHQDVTEHLIVNGLGQTFWSIVANVQQVVSKTLDQQLRPVVGVTPVAELHGVVSIEKWHIVVDGGLGQVIGNVLPLLVLGDVPQVGCTGQGGTRVVGKLTFFKLHAVRLHTVDDTLVLLVLKSVNLPLDALGSKVNVSLSLVRDELGALEARFGNFSGSTGIDVGLRNVPLDTADLGVPASHKESGQFSALVQKAFLASHLVGCKHGTGHLGIVIVVDIGIVTAVFSSREALGVFVLVTLESVDGRTNEGFQFRVDSSTIHNSLSSDRHSPDHEGVTVVTTQALLWSLESFFVGVVEVEPHAPGDGIAFKIWVCKRHAERWFYNAALSGNTALI